MTQLAIDAYTTTKRHRDAIAAQGGACNVVALATALADAVRNTRAAGKSERTDDACRLIAHQIAFLLDVRQLDDPSAYVSAMENVEREVKASPKPAAIA